MVNVLPHQGGTALEVAIALFFGALFGWISIGFWTAMLGFLLLAAPPRPLRDHDARAVDGADAPIDRRGAHRDRDADLRGAGRARLRRAASAIYRSLERAGALEHFHFFVLSDSADPGALRSRRRRRGSTGAATSTASTASSTGAASVRVARKSGNVADFCRRWGRRYRYMIMLDADSVMSGDDAGAARRS